MKVDHNFEGKVDSVDKHGIILYFLEYDERPNIVWLSEEKMLQLDIDVERMDQDACKIPTAPGKSIFSFRLPTYRII